MMDFEYRDWARFGPGSSVTMAVEMTGFDMRVTLKSLDGDHATLVIDWVDSGPAKHPGGPYTIKISAKPLVPAAPSRKRKSRTPVEKIVRPQKEAPPALATVAEGNEVIEMAGEQFLCRWVERRGSKYGNDYSVKSWISEQVPGGIVQVEEQYPLGNAPSRWTLKAYESK